MEAATSPEVTISPTALWIIVTGLVALVIYALIKFTQSPSLPLPPGPRGLPAVWSLMRAVRSGAFHQEASSWGPPGSPITCAIGPGGPVIVSLNSPELIREALIGRDTADLLNDRPSTFVGKFLFYGSKDMAMSSPTSPVWAIQRKMFHSSLRLYGDGVQQFESTVQGELSVLTELLQERQGQDVCLDDVISTTILNILTILMTGERPDKDSDVPEVLRSVDRQVTLLSEPSVEVVLRLFPFMQLLPTWYRRQYQLARNSRDTLMERLFSRAKEHLAEADEPRGIVEVMLRAQQSGTFPVTDEHIKGLLLDILVGAYVTSLTTFLSTVLIFLNLPSVARAIQKEIDLNIGQRTPTLDDRRNLPYFEATMLEVFRYMRFFPLGVPHTSSQSTQLGGYTIPKESLIMANQWESCRDPKAWTNPDKFIPERFLDDHGQLLPADHPVRKNLMPFGIGKRACPGETFGRTRLFLILTTLLQRFDFLPPESGKVIPLDNIPWIPGAVMLLPPYQCRIQLRQGIH